MVSCTETPPIHRGLPKVLLASFSGWGLPSEPLSRLREKGLLGGRELPDAGEAGGWEGRWAEAGLV